MTEPYACIVEIINQSFKCRSPEAVRRAINQIREWEQARRSLLMRKFRLEAAELATHIDALQRLVKKNAGKYTPRSEGPTPETACHPSGRDSIRSLEEAGKLNNDQVRAARQIQTIVESITRCVTPKGQSYERGSSGFRPESFMPTDIAVLWSQQYVPWTEHLKARADNRMFPITQLVVIDGISLDMSRKKCRASWERAHQLLIEALDLWWDLKNNPRPPPRRSRIREITKQ